MKGTEVPNPQRSSACDCACDCTCVLTRNRSLSYDSFMLAMRILFCSCPCKVRSRVSDTLSQALCNLSSAFRADFTLSDSMTPIRFIIKLFFSQTTLCFSFGLKDKITAFTCLPSYRYSSFTLWAYLCWRHTYCQWPIIELTKKVSPKNKIATTHVIRMCIFHGVKNG